MYNFIDPGALYLYTITIMAIKVGVGISRQRDVLRAAQEALLSATRSCGENPDLAILFSSLDLAETGLLKIISAGLKDTPIIGCSGPVVISRQGIFNHGLALMLLKFPAGAYFSTAYINTIKERSALDAGEELGERLLRTLRGMRRDLILLLSNSPVEEGPKFIDGLQERLGRSFPMIGASLQDALGYSKTQIYFNQQLLDNACAAILWGGKLNFGLGVGHGWKMLGKPRPVTRSLGNVVHEIDGKPAINLYEEYFGRDFSASKKELKRISLLYPIGIRIPQEKECLLRNIISVEEDGSLILQGNIPQNSSVRLMIATEDNCLKAAGEAATNALGGVNKANFLLVFNSMARYKLLGRDAASDLETIIAKVDASVPLIGIYTYGEQAPLMAIGYKGKSYFHNHTLTILAMEG
ncbi:FIST signal transduction protein [Candidatus Omnitrophota bacterium]